jgi:hypothetical protein
MAKKKNGLNIQANRDITIGGDVVGRDKITNYNVEFLNKEFAQIQRKIEERAEDPQVGKDELKATVQNIEKEVKKGEAANPGKVHRWLGYLAGMADDIFQVTVATLANPLAGVAKTVQLIAQKAKENQTGE